MYAQYTPVTGSFSGTAAPTTSTLQANTIAGEYQFDGNSNLGVFTFRAVTASGPASVPVQPPPGKTCAISGSVVAGAGVVRSQDGSLLMVNSAQGTDCIMFPPTVPIPQAYCTRTFKIAGGTGRFKDASGGTVTFTFTVIPVSFDTSGNPALSAITDGQLTGTLSK